MSNSRFTVAVHALTAMAVFHQTYGDAVSTSEDIATSVNTNPVVIRRILGELRKAGLVTSQPGVHGGVKPARKPEQITLLDIYRAVQQGDLLPLHANPPNMTCTVGSNIGAVLQNVFGRAASALEAALAQVTIADVARETMSRASPGQ